MKKILLLLVLLLMLVSCGMTTTGTESDVVQQKATEQVMQEMNAEIGMPAITNFQERKLAKLIFEERDKADLVCYAYIVNMQGSLIFIGECIGYGLPYSVQYTSPIKLVDNVDLGEGWGSAPMPQADPNGLFMPEGLSATWLMLIDPQTGNPEPVYVEPEIMVSPFPLH